MIMRIRWHTNDSILFLKEKIDQVPVTTTQFDDKMRLEGVKGCQWELIYGWTSVLTTFLQLRNHVFLPWWKWQFWKKCMHFSIKCMHFFQNCPFHHGKKTWFRSWSRVASTDVQFWMSTHWHPLTLSDLILAPGFVFVCPTFWPK